MFDDSASSEVHHELRAIFLCEFDNTVGRTLAFQEPADTFSPDEFDDISDYLIPKPQLCGNLVTLRLAGRVVLCWPVCLESTQYARNALIFSLGFVMTPRADVDSEADEGVPADHDTCARFCRVLGKVCAHLTALEHERRLLSEPEHKIQVQQALSGCSPT